VADLDSNQVAALTKMLTEKGLVTAPGGAPVPWTSKEELKQES